MPDVLIRGMEMPKSCDECRLFNESWCMALSVENWRKSYNKPPEGGRLPDCPLVPLPEGHGRLIDADSMLRKYVTDAHGLDGIYDTTDLPEMLSYMPSIVPAEGGTDDV